MKKQKTIIMTSIERAEADRAITAEVIRLAGGWGVPAPVLRPLMLAVVWEQAVQHTGVGAWRWHRALWRELPTRAVTRATRQLATLSADPESFEVLLTVYAPMVAVTAEEIEAIGGAAWAARLAEESQRRAERWRRVVVASDARWAREAA